MKNKIIFPLSPSDQGQKIANLHYALLFLKEKINALDFEISQSEIDKKFYGRFTKLAVREIQDLDEKRSKHKRSSELAATGKIDEATGKKLNNLLRENGYFKTNTLAFHQFNNTAETIGGDPDSIVSETLNEHLEKHVLDFFPNVSDVMKSKVKAEIKDYSEYTCGRPLSAIIKEDIIEKLVDDKELEEEIFELDTSKIKEASSTVTELLHTSKKLKDNPLLKAVKQRTVHLQLADSVLDRLNEEKKEALLAMPLEYLDAESWKKIGEENGIEPSEIKTMQLKADLSRMTGQNFALIDNLTSEGCSRIDSTKELIELSATDWKGLTADLHEDDVPDGESRESYAKMLHLNVNLSHPSQHMLRHFALEGREINTSNLDTLQAVFENTDERISLFSNQVVTPEVLEDFDEDVQTALIDTVRFVNKYRHLEIEEILSEPNSRGEDFATFIRTKNTRIQERVNLLETFYQSNPNIDLRYADLNETNEKLDQFYTLVEDEIGDSKVLRPNWSSIAPDDKEKLKKQLKVYQRLLRISPKTDEKDLMLSAGFESARDIAETPFNRFVERTHLDKKAAVLIHKKAKDNTLMASHLMMAALTADRDNRFMPGSLSSGNVLKGLKDVESYSAWFGNQNYCKCEHCRSIFSPAAYFVDLMHFVETHISEPSFINPGLTAHSIYLKNRRSDLWTLELSCENTSESIPYLQIVIEVLEAYLGGEGIYDSIKSANNHFNFPLDIDFESSRIHLKKVGTSRLEITNAIYTDYSSSINNNYDPALAEYLNLSESEWNVIATEDTNDAVVRFKFKEVDEIQNSNVRIEVQSALKTLQISREELEDLIGLNFVQSVVGTTRIEMEQGDEVNQFVEYLTPVNGSKMDRLHRFYRLYKKSSWTVFELNLLLTHLRVIGFNEFDGSVLNALGYLRKIQLSLDISTSEVGVFVGRFTNIPAEKGGLSLIDSLIPGMDRHLFMNSGLNIHHHDFNELDTEDMHVDDNFFTLANALEISESEFLSLLRTFPPSEDAITPDRNINIRDEHLAVYFKHCRLAQMFQLSVESYFRLLEIYGKQDELNTLEGISELIDFHAKIDQSILPFEERVDLLFQPTFDQENEEQSAQLVDVINQLKQTETRLFRNDIFQSIEDLEDGVALDLFNLFLDEAVTPELVTPVKSEKADEENINVNNNRFQLIADYNADWELSIPEGTAEAKLLEKLEEVTTEIKSVFASFSLEEYLLIDLPFVLSVNQELFKFLLQNEWVHLELEDVKSFYFNLAEDISPDEHHRLFELKNELEFWQTCQDQYNLSLNDFALINERRAQFGFSDELWDKTTFLHQLDKYQQLTTRFNEDWTQEEQHIALSEVLNNPSAFQLMNESAHEVIDLNKQLAEQLASILDTEVSQIPIVWQHSLSRSGSWLDRLTHMSALLAFSEKVNIRTGNLYEEKSVLNGFEDADFQDVYIHQFADQWKEKIEAANDQINTLKRDALVAYIIRRDAHFSDKEDLYQYFLLDVSMEGCGRTTRVLSAISSLQLYVHRVRMQLEIPRDGLADVQFSPQDSAAEWEWRKNYRVWEANRKVFLYPENYIEPDLRDNKTHLFKELEENLLQTNVTKASAEIAYKKYMLGFSDLADMRIAGVYFYKTEEQYFIFGHTLEQHPRYFYRTFKYARTWTPWVPIDLPIEARHINAIHYQGKLHVFWLTIPTFEEESNGERKEYYAHGQNVILNSSFLNVDKNWSEISQFPLYQINLNKFGKTQDREIETEIKYKEYKDLSYFNKAYPIVENGKLLIQCCYMYVSGVSSSITGRWRTFVLDLFQNKLTSIEFEEAHFETFARVETSVSDISKRLRTVSVKKLEHISDDSVEFPGGHDVIMRAEEAGSLIEYITSPISTLPDEVHTESVNKRKESTILHFKKTQQSYLVHQWGDIEGFSPDFGTKRFLYRLSTSANKGLSKKLFRKGVEAMLASKNQWTTEKQFEFEITNQLELAGPIENRFFLDFKGAYGIYYREIFFHTPFLLANYLNSTGKYEEADYWYRFIFDPTNKGGAIDGPHRVWKYIEFFLTSFFNLNESLEEQLSNQSAIETYKKDPFNPHAIARLRTNSYMKRIVMKYVDNLLDWGDKLFRQDTYESINEALMLYVLASDILGERPIEVGDCETADNEHLTYENIGPAIKDSEFLIEIENGWQGNDPSGPSNPLIGSTDLSNTPPDDDPDPLVISSFVSRERNAVSTMHLSPAFEMNNFVNPEPDPETDGGTPEFEFADDLFIGFPKTAFAFCIPNNKDMLAYWDRVADRLFKIRNCLNIDGVKRQLSFFQPPIDPMLLVRAKAQGLSISDILDGLAQELPPYRFTYLLEKSRNYVSTAQSLGNTLLSALEKKDGEALQLLRNTQEQEILEFVTISKKKQIEEAEENLKVLGRNKEIVEARKAHYTKLLTDVADAELAINEQELQYKEKLEEAKEAQNKAQGKDRIAAGLSIAPSFSLGAFGRLGRDPKWDWGIDVFNISYGTSNVTAIFNNQARKSRNDADQRSYEGNMANIDSGHQRRKAEWEHQENMAAKELAQLEQQKIASEIRLSIAEHDLKIHKQQIEHSKELRDFYKDKFTNVGLYTYLSAELQKLYRQTYNLAYAMAQKAERSYQFELDDAQAFFLKGDNWTGSKAGLLAGERLMLQLQQMETAYIENNKRDYEVTQTFSVRKLHPESLMQLRTTGSCEIVLPEWAYDIFYSGQYHRRVKSVRLSIPCIVGPNTNVGCKLTLLRSWVRKGDNLQDPTNPPIEINNQRNTSIATSTAQADGGVFELNFRDERYVPFEGAGAISSWRLELPETIRSFDYNTISDMLMHVSYTAKDDGVFKTMVEDNLQQTIAEVSELNPSGFMKLLDTKHDFPNAWHKMLVADNEEGENILELTMNAGLFSYLDRSHLIRINSIHVIAKCANLENYTLTFNALPENSNELVLIHDEEAGNIHQGVSTVSEDDVLLDLSLNTIWSIRIESPSGEVLSQDEIDEMHILLNYEWEI